MDARQIAQQRRAHARARTLGTTNPICRVCGKSDRRLRFEQHHVVARFAGRRLSEETVLLCKECHDRASDMQSDYLPLDKRLNPAIAFQVNRDRGQADLLELIAEQLRARANDTLARVQLDPAEAHQ